MIPYAAEYSFYQFADSFVKYELKVNSSYCSVAIATKQVDE